MLEWWNGRHEGLKIPWPLWLCGFESRFEHRKPSVISRLQMAFLFSAVEENYWRKKFALSDEISYLCIALG